jgi:hypothetical protein
MFYFSPAPVPGFPAREPNFAKVPKSHSLRIIPYRRSATFHIGASPTRLTGAENMAVTDGCNLLQLSQRHAS